ncbi:MAG TPA: ABC transporter ATP-binding protein [Dissulfurispiraceae bacterium]|nr:ABC transporter ATP-binding protein [Dissulfurispiraceae bacterium]
MIEISHISYSYYKQFVALRDVSLSIAPRDKFAVIGSNGSGKSTLLQILGGLLFPSQGEYLFQGTPVTEDNLKEKKFLRFFRQRVGYVFQDSDIQLFCPTVADELLFGPLQVGLMREEAMDRAMEILKMLKIENLKDRPTYMLSGGEKKRVALGSVLTMNPDVLLLDEPTNGLDPRTQVFLLELILALNEAGKTIVIATHDLSLVSELHAGVAVLSEGHEVEKTGNADDILHDEELLLKVNLIHEHVHYHDGHAHSHLHSHYLFHKH